MSNKIIFQSARFLDTSANLLLFMQPPKRCWLKVRRRSRTTHNNEVNIIKLIKNITHKRKLGSTMLRFSSLLFRLIHSWLFRSIVSIIALKRNSSLISDQRAHMSVAYFENVNRTSRVTGKILCRWAAPAAFSNEERLTNDRSEGSSAHDSRRLSGNHLRNVLLNVFNNEPGSYPRLLGIYLQVSRSS